MSCGCMQLIKNKSNLEDTRRLALMAVRLDKKSMVIYEKNNLFYFTDFESWNKLENKGRFYELLTAI